jgi:hypothetical protein
MATQVRERKPKVTASSRRVLKRPFGLKAYELVAAMAVMIFFILTLIFYFGSLKPKQEEVVGLERQLETLKTSETNALKNLNKGPGAAVEDKGKVALDSLSYFKHAHLKPLSQGRIALINEINAMAKKNNVTLMSGIDMKMDRAVINPEDDKETSKRKNKESFLRVFPNLEMQFTVAGEYKPLRQFISDLEANKQFKTIESINLNILKETEGTRTNRRTRISGIALTIAMTAYFYPETR